MKINHTYEIYTKCNRLRITHDVAGGGMMNTRILIYGTVCILTLAPWSFARQPVFEPDLIVDFQAPVFGLAAGDIDPDHPGDEIAVLVRPSNVLVVYPGQDEWSDQLIYSSDDTIEHMVERPSIEIGDVHGGHAGNEIVVNGQYHLTVIFPTRETDHFELIYDLSGSVGNLWGARVGDIDLERPGDEILLIEETVFDHSIAKVYREVNGVWTEETVYAEEVGMDSDIGEFNDRHPGNEIVLGTEMGPTYEILPAQAVPPGETWPRRTIWNDPENAAWDILITDVDPLSPGNEIVYGTRYNNSILISYPDSDETDGVGHILTKIFTGLADEQYDARNIWDIAVGDVWPETPGVEIVGVDETGSVYLVWRDESTWQGKAIWQDPIGPVNAVLIGDFDPSHNGNEILVGGVSGALTLLKSARGSFVHGWDEIR